MKDFMPPRINPNGIALLVVSEAASEDFINGRLLSGVDGDLVMRLFSDSGLKMMEFSYATAFDVQEGENDAGCKDRLAATIREIRPQYIISMGNDALQFLTKKSGIKKYRGNKLSLHESYGFECFVYPTYSTRDLRNVPTFKRTIIADLRNTQQGESDMVKFEFWHAD
jgi:uracil-DNA glycosylase